MKQKKPTGSSARWWWTIFCSSKDKTGVRKNTRKRIQTDRKVYGVNTRMIMANITSQIEIKSKLIYSFKSEVHCGAAKIVDYNKKLTSPPSIFSNAEDFQAYIEECVKKLLDLENMVKALFTRYKNNWDTR